VNWRLPSPWWRRVVGGALTLAVADVIVQAQKAVDLETVRADLAGVVSRALEPAHVSVWINQRG